MNHRISKSNYKTIFSLFISALTITILSSNYTTPTHADTPASSSSSANASITVSNTINLTLTGGDLVISNLTPGSASDSNIITATITSNSPYGYHLSATTGTSSGTTSLVNTADSNFVFTNLNANKATLNDFSDNTWGYSYSTDNGTSWISGDYGTALSGYNGLTLDDDDSGATGTTLYNNDSYAGSTAVKFKIGAKSATTQAAGTYTGTVNFYAVTNPGPDNTMQGFAAGNASTTCTAMSTGDTLKLKDSRDNTEYTIGKLADGKCWLLDNLAIDVADTAILSGLNSNNTNASDNTLDYLKGVKTRNANTDPEGKYATSKVGKDWDGSYYSYSDPLINVEDIDVIPQGRDPIASEAQAGGWKVGGYYNYCAASAGSNCYGDGTTSTSITYPDNATEDICPAGWRMPSGGSDSDYVNLSLAVTGKTSFLNQDESIALRRALRLPLPGRISTSAGRIEGQGDNGYYWSSTTYVYSGKYVLMESYDSVTPYTSSSYSQYGYSVRCILGSSQNNEP